MQKGTCYNTGRISSCILDNPRHRGAHPPPPPPPLFWVRKEEMTEGKMAGRKVNQDTPPLAQGLDLPLSCNHVTFQVLLEWSVIYLLASGDHEQLHFHHLAHLQCFLK